MKKNYKLICFLIMAISFVIRLIYVVKTPYFLSRHDVGTFGGLTAEGYTSGHFGYIEYLLKYRELPDFNPTKVWSFCTPPGYHIIAATVMGIVNKFGVPEPECYKVVQYVSFAFVTAAIFVIYKIICVLEVDRKYVIFFTSLASFFPFFILFSAVGTNDTTSIFFALLAIYFAIRWSKNNTYKNILAIAFCLGYSMFAKISGVTVCFGIAFLFLYHAIKSNKNRKRYFGQFAAFFALCAPLGLWYPIRNYIKYDIPIFYVQPLGKTDPQYIGAGIKSRIFGDISGQLKYAFTKLDFQGEINIFIQTLRTMLFDEAMLPEGYVFGNTLGILMLWISVGVAVILNIAILWFVVNKKTANLDIRLMFFISYLTVMGLYVKLCIDEPFWCTMSFRYIGVSLGFLLPAAAAMFSDTGSSAVTKALSKLAFSVMSVFLVLTIIFSIYLIMI